MQSEALSTALRKTFDKIYVINLVERDDRRREMVGQLEKVFLGPEDALVTFFPAIRPDDAGSFPSVGARGCFLSHLGIIENAIEAGHKSILILEDDADWTTQALRSSDPPDFDEQPWEFVHGGDKAERGRVSLRRLPPDEPRMLTHFIGLRGSAIGKAQTYLSAMLGRPGGSDLGGPMHVDGAYSWFRKDHPEIQACVFEPAIARQRPSLSDVTAPSGLKGLAPVQMALSAVRRLRKL